MDYIHKQLGSRGRGQAEEGQDEVCTLGSQLSTGQIPSTRLPTAAQPLNNYLKGWGTPSLSRPLGDFHLVGQALLPGSHIPHACSCTREVLTHRVLFSEVAVFGSVFRPAEGPYPLPTCCPFTTAPRSWGLTSPQPTTFLCLDSKVTSTPM